MRIDWKRNEIEYARSVVLSRVEECLRKTSETYQRAYDERKHYQLNGGHDEFIDGCAWQDTSHKTGNLSFAIGPISVYTLFGDSSTTVHQKSSALESLVMSYLRNELDDKYIKIILHEQLYKPTEIQSDHPVRVLLTNAYLELLKEYILRTKMVSSLASEIESELELFADRRVERSYDLNYNDNLGMFEIELKYEFLDDDESDE